jgi:hypothetical protein
MLSYIVHKNLDARMMIERGRNVQSSVAEHTTVVATPDRAAA